MTNRKEMFLYYLRDLYKQNPNLEITTSTIYSELTRFISYENNELKRIEKDNLVNIQVQLNNKYKNKILCSTANSGYFFFIENRLGNTDTEFYTKMQNSIKIYILCDTTNIYKLADTLFEYMIKEKIITQSKIAKEMRNDCFVVRVSTKEEAEKVCNYINKINKNNKVSHNPFMINNGKVDITIDGRLSYNTVLSMFLTKYISSKKKNNTLDTINIDSLINYIQSEILICSNDSYYLYNNYDIGITKYNDFLLVAEIILNNLKENITKEELYNYQINKKDTPKEELNNNEEKVLYIIYRLSAYYDTTYIHKLILEYYLSGNVNIFTRKDNIRNIVIEYLPREELRSIIIRLGKSSLKEAIELTTEKYGESQSKHAITKFVLANSLEGFTRNKDARNRLGLISPKIWIRTMIRENLKEEQKEIFDMFINLPKDKKTNLINYIENKAKGNNRVDEEYERLSKLIDIISTSIYENIAEETEKNTKIIF